MRDKILNYVVSILAVFLTLLGLEFSLRYFEKSNRLMIWEKTEDKYVIHHPNLDEYRYDPESGQEVRIKTNSAGFIGADVVVEKPSSTYRIAVVGDSFVEAAQVDYDKNFVYLLEKKLNEQKNQDGVSQYEVMNFGVSDQGTIDARLNYLKFVKKYNPDLVVLVMFVRNDIEDDSKYFGLKDAVLNSNSTEPLGLKALVVNEEKSLSLRVRGGERLL